jgi:predicted permease
VLVFASIHRLAAAARALRRAPGFALAVALTLALGIGLASATAVVARAVAFAGLPIPEPDRVVVLWGADRTGTMPHVPLAPRDLPALAEAMRGVATVAAGDYYGANPWTFRASDGGPEPLRLRGTLAGGTYFGVLGARPVLGRAIGPADDVPGAPRVVVLSDAAWRAHFGADPRVIGRALFAVQQGAPYTVVGVMPPGLDVPRGVEFWTAMAPTAAVGGSMERSWASVDVVARLAPDVTPEQARAALTAFYGRLARERPSAGGGNSWYDGARATVRTLPEFVTGDVRPAFTALAAAAAVVLLVTCGNVAGLLLVRAARRRRELAVRAAVGAGRGRLLGQLAAEHAVLAAAGGVLGAGLAAALVGAFKRLAPTELPRLTELGVDWRVLAAASAVTGAVALVVGLGPAVLASDVAPLAALGGARDASGAGGGRASDRRVRQMLVGTQVALALVVLAAAGLVGRSLARLTALDLGIPARDQLALVELVLPAGGAPGESPAAAAARWRDQFDAVMARVRATPGVAAVAPAVAAPFAGTAGWDFGVAAEGAAAGDTARRPTLNAESTGPEYLRATGVALLRGRFFTDADRADAPPVAVLSARAARALFPAAGPTGEDAVGRRVRTAGVWRTVVGVVGDTRYRDLLAPRATVYFPFRQFDQPPNYLGVRVAGAPHGDGDARAAALAATAVRRAAAEAAPGLLVRAAGTVGALAGAPLAGPRLLSAVLGAYALVVVALAVAGLYAVAAGSVAGRRREFGVRAAVGATPRALSGLVLGEGLRVAAAGAAVGLLGALAGGRLLAATLYDVAPADARTLGAAVAALLLVCLVAVWVPARRAASADPARVLRAE